jgi:hypothetical protein
MEVLITKEVTDLDGVRPEDRYVGISVNTGLRSDQQIE